MKRNFIAHSIVRLTQECSVTRPSSSSCNAQAPNAPVSENQAAFPSPSRSYEGAAFHQQKLLLDSAKSSAKKDPIAFCGQFYADTSGLTEKSRIELAKLILEASPRCLAENIRKFKIFDERVRTEFAKIVAEKSAYALAENIQNFSVFFDESARIKLAHIVAKKEPIALISHIRNFEIFDESAKIELLHIAAEKEPVYLASHIQNFSISNESVRIGLAQILAEKYPTELVKNFQNFAISDENAKIRLAQILVKKHLSTSFISDDLGYLEKLQISNRSALSNLYASVYLGLIAKGKMHETDKAWINNFFPRESQSMSLAHVATQFGNPHPVIAEFLKAAEQQPDPHIREILSTWTHLVSLRFAADQLPETAWQGLKGPLEAIWKWRAPAMRYVLTHLLAQQCLPPEAKDVDGFLAFCKQFTKPHTHLYPALLFPLFQSAPNDLALEKLMRLLRRPEFKDVKRQKAVLNVLVALVQADRFPDDLKRSLLQAAVSNGNDREAARSLKDTAPLMECLVSLSPRLGNAALPRLQSIHSPGDFNAQMNKVFKDLFPGLFNAQNAATCLNRLEDSRHPAGMFSYAAKMQNGLVDYEKASVLAAIGQFVKATVLSPNPEHAFRELRYDSAKSPHLRLLADKAPTKFAQWQQPCIYEPSVAFLDEAADSTEKTNITTHLQQCTVIDTDAAADLFLCGTEVVGSCQSIQDEPRSNKALMGYVLDGKYRLLAIKSAEERLMGRRMLRLLWDEQAQQPVLHLERLYHNPGVPKKYQQALVELAQQKARQMGCALVSHDQALQSDGDYPAPLIAYPTHWPFEYIDAKGLGVRPGMEGYQLSGAKIVASPY